VAPADPALVDSARDAAAGVASRAGVEVRLIPDPADLLAAARLFESIWGVGEATANLLKALEWTGNYVSGAFESGTLVGGSFGFVGASSLVRSLHSHVTAVAPDHQGGGVGLALKFHQRAWALGQGIEEITWTFDPLVRRNGWFNLMKLGAEADSYYADFYGRLPDLVNEDDETDRCVARWRLDVDVHWPQAAPLASAEGVSLVVEDNAGGPRVVAPMGGLADVTGERVLCQVPVDILALRRRDAASARRWRLAVRETMGRAIDQGYVATAMTADGQYLLTRRRP
jgi:predicted GNAT superfamily acetyltransferase